MVQTTMSYVKQAEDLGSELGLPCGPLPEALSGSGLVSAFWPGKTPRKAVEAVPEEGVEPPT